MEMSLVRGIFAATALVGGLAACGDDDVAPATGDDPQAAEGQEVFASKACAECHSTSGGGGRGPDLDGIYGEEIELADGGTVVVDDEYLARSIEDPGADIVEGYDAMMPDRGLSADEVEAVVAYIRSLSD